MKAANGTSHSNDGHLADNVVQFARALRRAGLPVGPALVVDALRAVRFGGIDNKQDFYWTLHAVFVSRRDHHPVFDQVFNLFWRERGLLDKILEILSPVAPPRPQENDKPEAAQTRAEAALAFPANRDNQPEQTRIEVDARLTISSQDILRGKDFAQMTAEELDTARQAIGRLRLPDDSIRSRRLKPAPTGQFDPRRTMQKTLRAGGDIILPAFRERRTVKPPIVALCDISGSMSDYSRILLHFHHALAAQRQRVHTFVFGTRLTNVTRQLARKDPDEALSECSEIVEDWSGGTRIASALWAFNKDWSRRVLGQGATVLLITDGLERDDLPDFHDGPDLAAEMDRLHRSCRRLIWLNPLLRFEGFEAKARGIRAMLPHVDEFRSAHSLDAMSDLVAALSGKGDEVIDPKTYLQAA